MNQQKGNTLHNAIARPTKPLRRIRKPIKIRPFRHNQKKNNGFVITKQSSSRPIPSRSSLTNNSNRPASWLSLSPNWIQSSQSALQRCISSVMQQMPMLSFIDELFSLSSTQTLQPNCDWLQLLRYARICSLFDLPTGSTVVLREGEQGRRAVVGREQGWDQGVWRGMQLLEQQPGLWERRAIFMEKLRSNQSKYDTSLGRMSEISKELAFTYRSYLETRAQVSSSLNSLLPESLPNHSQLLQISTRYARALLAKNLRHTFSSQDLDRLNYFKLRQYVEAGRVQDFENISSFLELQNFIQRRKPKRGRRLTLATACSVCLSDYHELSNPLRSCAGCGLRAHRLCFSFENKRCGYCSFQKLERGVKEAMGWCLICRKPGLMVVRLDQTHYAHGFCLLIQGFWRIGTGRDGRLQGEESNGDEKQGAILPFLEQRCQLLNEIEFYSPFDSVTKVSISVIDSALFDENLLPDDISPELPNPLQPQQNLSSQSLDIIDRFPNMQQNNFDNNVEFWSQQEHQQNGKDCRRCRVPFFQNCYLVCHRCGKEYHALCAFLAGFQMTVQEGQFIEGAINLPKMNCCSIEGAKVGWNRRFKLNYQRCAYEVTAQDVSNVGQSGLWME